jgi:hypothetical protein
MHDKLWDWNSRGKSAVLIVHNNTKIGENETARNGRCSACRQDGKGTPFGDREQYSLFHSSSVLTTQSKPP